MSNAAKKKKKEKKAKARKEKAKRVGARQAEAKKADKERKKNAPGFEKRELGGGGKQASIKPSARSSTPGHRTQGK